MMKKQRVLSIENISIYLELVGFVEKTQTSISKDLIKKFVIENSQKWSC